MTENSDSWYARPVFFVADCETALRFYETLGFKEKWRHPEEGKLTAVQVDRDGTELILNQNSGRAGGGRLFLSLQRGQVATCIESFATAGVKATDDYWGMPVKVVTDPDGNDLLFFDDDLTVV